MDFGKMIQRVIRAVALDVRFYNEVEADISLTREALYVVIITSLLGGFGAFLEQLSGGEIASAIWFMIVFVALGVVGYYLWAYVTYLVGVHFFQGQADVGEMLRTLGYATAPRALAVFSFIPCVGPLIGFVGAVWALAAGVIAVREALDFDTTRAVVTVIIGWVVLLVVNIVVGLILGIGSAGMSLIF